MIRTLETTNTLSEEIKKQLSTVTTKKTTFEFGLASPPGVYQSIMALKMTCGPYTIYPNFIDLVGRQLGDDTETHQYHAGQADVSSVTDPTQLANERRVAELAQGGAPQPQQPVQVVADYVPPPVQDDSIVGHAANLLQHLLGFWDKREHAYRRILPGAESGYSVNENHTQVNFTHPDNDTTLTNETDLLNGTEFSVTPSFLGNDTFANFTGLPSANSTDPWEEDKTQEEEEDQIPKLLS
ncbi:hypothetical protein AAVH_24754 [Aphelenchoides avenae]|nr:hypothetical protein AAVH_24754 [Aphelenchus avenae]